MDSRLCSGARPIIPVALVVRVLRVQGGMENVLGEPELADERWEHALAIAQATGQEQAVAVLQHRLADMARRLRGDLAGARALAEASLETHRRNGFRKGETQVLTALADIELAEGRPEQALELLYESARIAEEIGFRWWLSGVSSADRRPSASRSGGSKRRLRAHRRPSRSRPHTRPPSNRRRAHPARRDRCRFRQPQAAPGRCSGRPRPRASERRRSPWFHAPSQPRARSRSCRPGVRGGRAEGRELSLDAAVALALATRRYLTRSIAWNESGIRPYSA